MFFVYQNKGIHLQVKVVICQSLPSSQSLMIAIERSKWSATLPVKVEGSLSRFPDGTTYSSWFFFAMDSVTKYTIRIQVRAKSHLHRLAKYLLAPLNALRPNYCTQNIFFTFQGFLQKELMGRIINSFSRFWDISKIQSKKKKKFLMLDYNISSYLKYNVYY